MHVKHNVDDDVPVGHVSFGIRLLELILELGEKMRRGFGASVLALGVQVVFELQYWSAGGSLCYSRVNGELTIAPSPSSMTIAKGLLPWWYG